MQCGTVKRHPFRSAEPSEISSEAEVERDVALLKQAANTMAVPSAAVLSALMRLEKKKLAVRLWTNAGLTDA